ncbi:pyridoxamine 5'-phosphate oxidase [Chryseobacterium sp. A301]
MENLHDWRQNYKRSELLETELEKNPMQQFKTWFLEAQSLESLSEPNAMAVSSLESDGTLRTRMVLLKEYTWEGFVFYTNYNSRKGHAIQEHPQISLHFFWPAMERQVLISARAEKVAESQSDGYFSQRPKGSQLGALVSNQSSVIPDRDYLENQMHKLEQQYEGKQVERPSYWGGYLAKPYEMEFWQGRPNRLHDRILYRLDEHCDWVQERLAP